MTSQGWTPGPAERSLEVRGVRVPRMIYGTAWKEGRTARLTQAALAAGFRGVDTANQRRHYFEAAVGDAVREASKTRLVERRDLFVQTKFTYLHGQDHRLPYDPKAPLAVQVEQSFASSLEHLGVEYLDSYLLHGPSTSPGLAEEDRETWRAMEALHRSGRVRLLGVSNVTIEQLAELHAQASVKPAIVQNRCLTRPQADRAVREFCESEGLAYQGFSLLTAIPRVLVHPAMQQIGRRTGKTVPQVVFRHALHHGMIVLTGTSSAEHMGQDLSVYEFDLEAREIEAIDRLVGWT